MNKNNNFKNKFLKIDDPDYEEDYFSFNNDGSKFIHDWVIKKRSRKQLRDGITTGEAIELFKKDYGTDPSEHKDDNIAWFFNYNDLDDEWGPADEDFWESDDDHVIESIIRKSSKKNGNTNMNKNKRFSRKVRKNIVIIAESMDENPTYLGFELKKGDHPIDDVIHKVATKLLKFDWNDKEFIKAVRDSYAEYGFDMPNSREVLISDIQNYSEQEPKLLNKLMAALGGMSRRTFMGLAGGATAAAATGQLSAKDFSADKNKDINLVPGKTYNVTYRNYADKTIVFKSIKFIRIQSNLYVFEHKTRRVRSERNRLTYQATYDKETLQNKVNRWKKDVNTKEMQMAGKIPYYGKTIKADRWPSTVDKLQRSIAFKKSKIDKYQRIINIVGEDGLVPGVITLREDKIIDVTN